MLASKQPVMGSVESTESIIQLPSDGTAFTIWSPSYRVVNDNGSLRDRGQTDCLFVGLKESLLFAGEGNTIHRRIVFWSEKQVEEAQPFSGPNEMLLRNIKLRDTATDSTLDKFLGGTRGRDFLNTTIFQRKLDSRVAEVVYDREESYAQYSTILKDRKFWHRCQREISYEDGQESGWAAKPLGGAGNLYVVDMFTNRSAPAAKTFVTFSSEVYWRERKI
jgi:hypothetical protein